MPINLGNYNFDDLSFCIRTSYAVSCIIDIIWNQNIIIQINSILVLNRMKRKRKMNLLLCMKVFYITIFRKKNLHYRNEKEEKEYNKWTTKIDIIKFIYFIKFFFSYKI